MGFSANDAVKITLDALTGPRFDNEIEYQHKRIRKAAERGEREVGFKMRNYGVNSQFFKAVKAKLIDEGFKVTTRRIGGYTQAISW